MRSVTRDSSFLGSSGGIRPCRQIDNAPRGLHDGLGLAENEKFGTAGGRCTGGSRRLAAWKKVRQSTMENHPAAAAVSSQ
ncbi:MAG: hypothetical protein ACLP9L_22625 [Thermoguttaceae bacterium]